MFDKKGTIIFSKDEVNEDELMEIVLEAGGDDVADEESEYEVITDPGSFEDVKAAIDDAGMKYLLAEISMVPQTTVKLDEKKATQMLKLMEQMEDNEDVQNVYANFDIPDEIMERLS